MTPPESIAHIFARSNDTRAKIYDLQMVLLQVAAIRANSGGYGLDEANQVMSIVSDQNLPNGLAEFVDRWPQVKSGEASNTEWAAGVHDAVVAELQADS
jgi:hypothetical protein